MSVKQIASLVLSAGGAKGYAHIGAIKAIEENGYSISSIAGTSMGALVGGLYAAGKLDIAYEWLRGIDDWDVFKLADFDNISHKGLINGDYIFQVLHDIIGDVKIEDLPIDYCAVAADLHSGEEVVFRSGRLIDAIRASISMPVFFVPYKINGRTYVDGGVANGLPINRVKKTKGAKVIVINLDTYGKSNPVSKYDASDSSWLGQRDFDKICRSAITGILSDDFIARIAAPIIMKSVTNLWGSALGDNVVSVLLNSFYIALKQNKLKMVEKEKPDIYINIDLKNYSTHNFSDAEAISNLGYSQVMKVLRSFEAESNAKY